LDQNRFAIAERAARLAEHFPDAVRFAEEEALPFPAGALTAAEQSRRYNLCIIEHQQIAGREQVRQISEDVMGE
jgi:hypothetical protein